MKGRFSVRFFKRVITFTVLGIILALLVTVIIQALRIGSLKEGVLNGTAHAYAESQPMDYQKKYPELYVENQFEKLKAEAKTVYLTFDDGPSKENTRKILDILEEYEIKATFFMVHNGNKVADEIIQRVIDEGHTIGIHTYSHDYEEVYQSVESYLDDFNKLWSNLKERFGYEAKIFRFPGGSINAYNLAVYDKIIPEMYRRGFLFYDWNASAEDAVDSGASKERIVKAILREVRRNDRSIVLMHDSSYMGTTVEALPEIIETLKEEGYTFKALDETVKPVSFARL